MANATERPTAHAAEARDKGILASTIDDEFEYYDRIYLEKLRLAATVILQAGQDPGVVTDVHQTELFMFRDRVDRAMLLKPHAVGGLLPWREPAPGEESASKTPDAATA